MVRKYDEYASRRGETLAAAIVGSLVLALALSGIAAILSANTTLETEYEKNNRAFLLEDNGAAIVRQLDTSGIAEGETFYVKKDSAARAFLVLTGSENADYQYVDSAGEWTNSGTTEKTVYTRSFVMEEQDPIFGSGGHAVRTVVKELLRD